MLKNEIQINKYPKGIVTPPPSKSVSHRALICASLAGGDAGVLRVNNLGDSEDITATRNAIRTILAGDNTKKIEVNESGSTLRFLIPLALDGKEWTFSGAASLFARPLGIYEDIIKKQDGMFELVYTGDNSAKDDITELKVKATLQSGLYEIPGNISSQFISGLLLTLPMLDGDSEIKLTTHLESESYVDITISCMKDFGVDIEKNISKGKTTGYFIRGAQVYKDIDYTVEADYSQAAFFLCAAALGADVKVAGLSENSLQGDKYILEVLRSMGAEIIADGGCIEVRSGSEPKGTSDSSRGKRISLNATTVDVSNIPDLVPPIAALACYAKGTTRLINAARLRMKESDRLAALASELSKIGADVEALHDELIICGKESLEGGIVDSWNDHRIAMSLALASIGCRSDVTIKRSDAVRKSYPNFWEDFCIAEKQNGDYR